MDPLKLYFLLTMVFPIDNGDITVSLLEDTCIRICFFRENMSKLFAPGMQSAVSCCRTSWGQGGNSRWNSKALSSQICHMSGVFCDTCKSISSFFVEVFMMVRWVLNMCLDEFYWKHLCKEEARPQSHAAVQAEEVGEGDELKTTPRETVLIRPATHTVCLFVSSCRCQDMHAAFVSFCTVQLKWFANWILIQSTLCPHQACKAQSHVAVQAEDRVEIHIGIPKLVMTDMSYVRRVLWYMRIYFFFRRSFHDGPMSFEYMPGWILLKASLQGGSKTSISCCCASRRGWRGRWT